MDTAWGRQVTCESSTPSWTVRGSDTRSWLRLGGVLVAEGEQPQLTGNTNPERQAIRTIGSQIRSSAFVAKRRDADGPIPIGSFSSERVAIAVVARPPRSLQAKSVVPATAGDLIRSRRQKSDERAAADLTAPRFGSELEWWTDRRRLRRCRRGSGRRRSTPGASWIDSMPQLASRGRR